MLATIPTTTLTHRDRAVLRAVAAGRCSASSPGALTVDGLGLADQFAGLRLADAGFITVRTGPVALTVSGQAVLAAA